MKILKRVSSFKNQEEYENYCDSVLCGLEYPRLSRIEHVVSVFLTGCNLIKKVFGFKTIELNTNHCVSFEYFWTFLSLFHDIGYGVQYQSKSNIKDYNPNAIDLHFLGSIFDAYEPNNQRWTSKYSKEEILFYYQYWSYKGYEYGIEEKWNDGYEIFEHGVLGGFLFSNLFHNARPASFKLSLDDWNDFVLGVSFIISIHNIWPIPNKYFEIPSIKEYLESSNETHVSITSFVRNRIPFSYKADLLAYSIYLIDSIDIVKKFYGEREEDGYEHICDYELLGKVLDKLDYSVKKDKSSASIVITFGEIKSVLEQYNRVDILEGWLKSIQSTSTFLCLEVEQNEDLIIIRIPA